MIDFKEREKIELIIEICVLLFLFLLWRGLIIFPM